MKLAERIRSEAAIATRPGQMAQLEAIADEVDRALAEAWDEGWQANDDRVRSFENPYRSG